MREDHSFRSLFQHDVGDDLVRPPAQVDRDALRHRIGPRVVHVAFSSRFRLRALDVEQFASGAVVQGKREVRLRLVEPHGDELLKLLGVLGGEVLRLGTVRIDVIQLPHVVVEVPLPLSGAWTADAFQPSFQMPRVPSME